MKELEDERSQVPDGTIMEKDKSSTKTVKSPGKETVLVRNSELTQTMERLPLWKLAARKVAPPNSQAQSMTRVGPATRYKSRIITKLHHKYLLGNITGSTKVCHRKNKDANRAAKREKKF